FGRLFDLAENKSASVAVMFSLGWEAGWEAIILQIDGGGSLTWIKATLFVVHTSS
ncbi:hypothetical protein A2U01_0085162, partial [Trifolium medium]|nr:hypothetical protein [Trifolium medium]